VVQAYFGNKGYKVEDAPIAEGSSAIFYRAIGPAGVVAIKVADPRVTKRIGYSQDMGDMKGFWQGCGVLGGDFPALTQLHETGSIPAAEMLGEMPDEAPEPLVSALNEFGQENVGLHYQILEFFDGRKVCDLIDERFFEDTDIDIRILIDRLVEFVYRIHRVHRDAQVAHSELSVRDGNDYTVTSLGENVLMDADMQFKAHDLDTMEEIGKGRIRDRMDLRGIVCTVLSRAAQGTPNNERVQGFIDRWTPTTVTGEGLVAFTNGLRELQLEIQRQAGPGDEQLIVSAAQALPATLSTCFRQATDLARSAVTVIDTTQVEAITAGEDELTQNLIGAAAVLRPARHDASAPTRASPEIDLTSFGKGAVLVVGPDGYIGRRHLAALPGTLARCKGEVELLGGLDIKPVSGEVVQLFRDTNPDSNVPTFFNSPQEAIYHAREQLGLEPSQIIVLIATPDQVHFQNIQEFTALGVNRFIVEKPVADNLAELEAIGDFAARENVRVTSTSQVFTSDVADTLREVMADHGFVPVYYLHHWTKDRTERSLSGENMDNTHIASFEPFHQLGLMEMFDPVVGVEYAYARDMQLPDGKGVFENHGLGAVFARHASGAQSACVTGFTEPGRYYSNQKAVNIVGRDGSVIIVDIPVDAKTAGSVVYVDPQGNVEPHAVAENTITMMSKAQAVLLGDVTSDAAQTSASLTSPLFQNKIIGLTEESIALKDARRLLTAPIAETCAAIQSDEDQLTAIMALTRLQLGLISPDEAGEIITPLVKLPAADGAGLVGKVLAQLPKKDGPATEIQPGSQEMVELASAALKLKGKGQFTTKEYQETVNRLAREDAPLTQDGNAVSMRTIRRDLGNPGRIDKDTSERAHRYTFRLGEAGGGNVRIDGEAAVHEKADLRTEGTGTIIVQAGAKIRAGAEIIARDGDLIVIGKGTEVLGRTTVMGTVAIGENCEIGGIVNDAIIGGGTKSHRNAFVKLAEIGRDCHFDGGTIAGYPVKEGDSKFVYEDGKPVNIVVITNGAKIEGTTVRTVEEKHNWRLVEKRNDALGPEDLGKYPLRDIVVAVNATVIEGRDPETGKETLIQQATVMNSEIGGGTRVQTEAFIGSAFVGRRCNIEPQANVRLTVLKGDSRVGAEASKTVLGRGTTAVHRSAYCSVVSHEAIPLLNADGKVELLELEANCSVIPAQTVFANVPGVTDPEGGVLKGTSHLLPASFIASGTIIVNLPGKPDIPLEGIYDQDDMTVISPFCFLRGKVLGKVLPFTKAGEREVVISGNKVDRIPNPSPRFHEIGWVLDNYMGMILYRLMELKQYANPQAFDQAVEKILVDGIMRVKGELSKPHSRYDKSKLQRGLEIYEAHLYSGAWKMEDGNFAWGGKLEEGGDFKTLEPEIKARVQAYREQHPGLQEQGVGASDEAGWVKSEGHAPTLLSNAGERLVHDMGYELVNEEVVDVPVEAQPNAADVSGVVDQQRISEMAALNVVAKGKIGSGDKDGVDNAGTEPFIRGYTLLGEEEGRTYVAAGEGRWDGMAGTAGMIEKGRSFGTAAMATTVVVVDPVDGTTWAAENKITASTHVSAATEEVFRPIPDIHRGIHTVFYSNQVLDIDVNDPVEEQLKAIARANGLEVSELEVYIRDFDFNEPIIEAARAAGAKVITEIWGGANPMISHGVDKHKVFMGVNGMVEAQCAAAALKNFQAQNGSGAQMVSCMIASKSGGVGGSLENRTDYESDEIEVLQESRDAHEITPEEYDDIRAGKKLWRMNDLVKGPAVYWSTMITADCFFALPDSSSLPGVQRDDRSGLSTACTVRVGPDGIKAIRTTYRKRSVAGAALKLAKDGDEATFLTSTRHESVNQVLEALLAKPQENGAYAVAVNGEHIRDVQLDEEAAGELEIVLRSQEFRTGLVRAREEARKEHIDANPNANFINVPGLEEESWARGVPGVIGHEGHGLVEWAGRSGYTDDIRYRQLMKYGTMQEKAGYYAHQVTHMDNPIETSGFEQDVDGYEQWINTLAPVDAARAFFERMDRADEFARGGYIREAVVARNLGLGYVVAGDMQRLGDVETESSAQEELNQVLHSVRQRLIQIRGKDQNAHEGNVAALDFDFLLVRNLETECAELGTPGVVYNEGAGFLGDGKRTFCVDERKFKLLMRYGSQDEKTEFVTYLVTRLDNPKGPAEGDGEYETRITSLMSTGAEDAGPAGMEVAMSRFDHFDNLANAEWNRANISRIHERSIAIQEQAAEVRGENRNYIFIPKEFIPEDAENLGKFNEEVRKWMEKKNCVVITEYTSEQLVSILGRGSLRMGDKKIHLNSENCLAYMASSIAERHTQDVASHVRILPLITPLGDQFVQFEGLINLGLGFLTIRSVDDTVQIENVRQLWNLMMAVDFDEAISEDILYSMTVNPVAFLIALVNKMLIVLPEMQRFDIETLDDLYGRAAQYLATQA